MNICDFNANKAVEDLKSKYRTLLERFHSQGAYVWGMGKLGCFCKNELINNGFTFRGFIDSSVRDSDPDHMIFSSSVLDKPDVVILATFSHVDIEESIESTCMYIYYEELAIIESEMKTYYSGFEGLFSEMEENKDKYFRVRNYLSDEISQDVFDNILNYRMTLDTRYSRIALRESIKHGVQDFDEVVLNQMNLGGYIFFDVGGFNGETTETFVSLVSNYKKILYFEPDNELIKQSKERLKDVRDIDFIQAGAGAQNGKQKYLDKGQGAGCFSESGNQVINIVALDNYIDDSKSYVKLDVEGMEYDVLLGMKNAIKKYRPIMGISVYHIPGDIHRLIELVMSWVPEYHVYLRHYTKTYADTMCYFVLN